MSRATRQLENGHAEVSRHAVVDAILKANGSRGSWEAIDRDGDSWKWQKICDDLVRPTCQSKDLVILRVLRRGFGG